MENNESTAAHRMKQKWMLFVVATVLAVWLSWGWGLAMLHWPISVLSGGDESQASIIRRVIVALTLSANMIGIDPGLHLVWISLPLASALCVMLWYTASRHRGETE